MLLYVWSVNRNGIHTRVDDTFTFGRYITPIGVCLKNTFMHPAEVEPYDNFYILLMAFTYHIAQHIVFHIRVGIMKGQFSGIKSHYSTGIDDNRVGRIIYEIFYKRIRMQRCGFIVREV